MSPPFQPMHASEMVRDPASQWRRSRTSLENLLLACEHDSCCEQDIGSGDDVLKCTLDLFLQVCNLVWVVLVD
jgi:hypothetical protein